MRKVPQADAQAQFDGLLDAVESGETFLIVDGERVRAWLIPEGNHDDAIRHGLADMSAGFREQWNRKPT